MKHQTEIVIQFDDAVQLSQEIQQEERQEQAQALNEFRLSRCDMFSIHDWMYYAEKTGKSIQWLRERAKYEESTDYVSDSLYSMIGSELDADDLVSMNF